MMMVLLSLSSCATTIKDFSYVALIPLDATHAYGAGGVGDNFLTSAPITYTQTQIDALFLSWVQSGNAVECTQSSAVADLKDAIEKLCSVSKCNEEMKTVLNTLKKLLSTAQLSTMLVE